MPSSTFSVPVGLNIPTYVVGVNEHRYVVDGAPDDREPARELHCLAPLAKLVDPLELAGLELDANHSPLTSLPLIAYRCPSCKHRRRPFALRVGVR